MVVKDKITNQRDTGSEEEPGVGVSQRMCSPSMSPLGLSAPKGRMFIGASRIGGLSPRFVPVVDKNNIPLMPTKLSRALSWLESRKATYFYIRGIFCVRLNEEPSARNFQDLACTIDPGSKKEGYTLKSKAHTYLNIQADAVTWVKDAMKTRREMRRGRRFRKTPCRQPRFHRKRKAGWIPPSTKARWAWKLRVVDILKRIFPITVFVVEDINAETKEGKRKWNLSFSPLQVGKHWFYQEIRKLGKLVLKQGYETAELREQLGLVKSKKKLEDSWNAHCVDSWAMAWSVVGGRVPAKGGTDTVSDGKTTPDNEDVVYISPIQIYRRQLHMLQPAKGGVRKRYGGTSILGLKKGSLVKHNKLGLVYVGGFSSSGAVTFYESNTGKLFKRRHKSGDCRVLSWNTWRIRANSAPTTRVGVPLAHS